MCALNPTAVWKHPSPSSHITRKAGGGGQDQRSTAGEGCGGVPEPGRGAPVPALRTWSSHTLLPGQQVASLLAGQPGVGWWPCVHVCSCTCLCVCGEKPADSCPGSGPLWPLSACVASNQGLSHLSHRCKRGSSVKTCFPLSASVSPVTWEAREVLTPRGICGRR